ncbi:cytochrome oxidase complex assembly protein 1-domain-containing protein [Mycena sp. CBHHK59/15]|nr:cytochrome oxidase complex assembly protein 1-domain-containing protein [Mycena sp. CBHHK59/15]
MHFQLATRNGLNTALAHTSRNALKHSYGASSRIVLGRPFSEQNATPSHGRPSLYSNFKPGHRDLPRIEKRWPTVLGITAVVMCGWAGFLTYVTNETKVTSSVVKQILRTIKSDYHLAESLGQAIRPQPEWWLNGYPIIHGQINQLQGNIDVSFRIKGSQGSGTVYFTSVRKAKGIPYEILRFRVIVDDGQVIEVKPTPS